MGIDPENAQVGVHGERAGNGAQGQRVIAP